MEVSGIEPPTSSLRTKRSSQLSYTPMGECRCYRALRLIVVPGTENPFGGYATGENIGQGPSVDGTFIQSPKHRANLRDPRWSWAGAGIARPSNGAVRVV